MAKKTAITLDFDACKKANCKGKLESGELAKKPEECFFRDKCPVPNNSVLKNKEE